MVLGIDAREAADKPAGKGRYVLELLKRLPAALPDGELSFFVGAEKPDIALPEHAAWETIIGSGIGWHRAAAKHANAHCDAYFSTTSYLTPRWLRIPYALMVHDLISFQPGGTAQRRARLIERATLRRAADHAAAIITNSQQTADDLATWRPRLADKTTPIPLAAGGRFRADWPDRTLTDLKRRYDLPDRFVLFVGTLEPRKNVVRLIDAFLALLAERQRDCPLVLAGKWGWQSEPIGRSVTEAGAAVHHLDFVPEEDLAPLYAAATVFCYPSLYEGFGLPVLEALQSGTPVITSAGSALAEVGGDAVRYVDPRDTEELTEALRSLLGDATERRRLSEAGITQAARFSWDRTVMATAEVLRSVAATVSPRL